MDRFRITKEDIYNLCGQKNVTKANDYLSNIHNTYIYNDMIVSQCQGSLIYSQSCKFYDNTIQSINCSCPAIINFGPCKHIAALLLTWLEKPMLFKERQDLNTILSQKSSEELKRIILTLCAHSAESEDIVYKLFDFQTADNSQNACFLADCKTTISNTFASAVQYCEEFDYAIAKKAIKAYSLGTNDPIGLIDLQLFFVECGNSVTLEYGDMDEQFYVELETMFEKALILMKKDSNIHTMFLTRVKAIIKSVNEVGWGYYDQLCDIFNENFPQEIR